MLGKAKCKILKEIRQKIADANDIPYVTRECTYQGDCSGTCPRCESELRYLERELEARQRRGKALAVTALCAGLVLGGAGCTPSDNAPTLAGVPQPMEDLADMAPQDDAPSVGVDGGETQTVPPLEGEVQPIDDPAPEDEVLPIDAPELEGKLVLPPEVELIGEDVCSDELEKDDSQEPSGGEALPPEVELMGDVVLPPEVELMGDPVPWDELVGDDTQEPAGDAGNYSAQP